MGVMGRGCDGGAVFVSTNRLTTEKK